MTTTDQSSSAATVRVTEEASVATVTLDRPNVRNAFNGEMIAALTRAFIVLGERLDIDVIVLQGAGKSFSAGADAAWMEEAIPYSYDQNLEDARAMARMFEAIDMVPQIVIGRVHGAAMGGGVGLAAVCDVVVAADNTTFGFTEVRLGIIPAVISAYVLPKIGESWARALYTTADRFDAAFAHHIGLVHDVAPEDDLDVIVREKVEAVLSGGPQATRVAKAIVREARGLDRSSVQDLMSRRIAERRVSEEGQTGLRAFLERRKPDWR